MEARPRPPHDSTGGFRKGGEQSQSCAVRHRPHSIRHPPASAEAPRCQVRRPSEQAGKGTRRGVEERRRRHRTVVDSAQTKWRRQKNRRSGGVGGRALACHTNTTSASGDMLALGCSARS
ncbi:unnamed protein product [Pleuronectes platessa]|uniref:Uncharacterized protein n=1 Tax=Pleuronectes platessa TaxID=8262 RepID=A0A9N7TZK0_PLEPL|nr:unnamed protein product [Pleuronectes platessa]